MTPDEALRTVAHRIISVELHDGERLRDLWEEYPEIGEHDFERIVSMVQAEGVQFAQHPDEYRAAYELLRERADAV